MAHSSALRWDDAATVVGTYSQNLLRSINDAEEIYQDLLEAFQYSGGTDQDFADLLFNTTADAAQVLMVTDLRNAIVALHDLYGAMTNVATTTRDRATDLRRMS